MKEMDFTSDWIDRYNEGELSPADRKIFEHQMTLNRLLRAEVTLDARLNRLLEDHDLLDLMGKVSAITEKRRPGINRLGYLLVAATILTLVTVGMFFSLNRPGLVPRPVVSNNQPARPLTNGGLSPAVPSESTQGSAVRENRPGHRAVPSTALQLAANYQPMAELESLVGTVTRSSQVSVTAPPVQTVLTAGSPLIFALKRENADIPVLVTVMNNLGKTIVENQGLKADSAVIETKGMPPGLYYWKVTLHDEFVAMGRIILH